MTSLISLIHLAGSAFSLLLIVRVVLSWVSPLPTNELARWVYRLTDPVLAPVRAVLPSLGGLDFSPLVALIAIQVLERLLVQMLIALAGA
ncbi:MAG: YggT family protein [Candidatus Lambdaproteobacteria bacterium]|nr:YggT family protein [Candidatus Lambdaproteobacteria bacterium]